MRQTLVLLRFVVALSSFAAFSAYAEGAAPLPDQREAQSWLRKIQSAAQKLNYSGTFVYQQGTQMRTSRITHLLDGKNEIEKLEILDGKPREYIRNNEEIMCYMPEAKTLLIEKRVTHDIFPAILGTDPAGLTESYNVQKAESGRVAGYDCQAIVLEPKDNLRYGYKLWAEKSTGLLLRAQTINEKKQILEQIAFTQIAIGNIDKDRVKPTFPSTTGWRVEHAVTSQDSISGWTVKSIPRGFKKIREIKRMVSSPSDGATAGGAVAGGAVQHEVSQLVFSDGLAAVSVFIEPGLHSRTEGSMQQGATNIIGKRQGEFWLTIVGEVPPVAIKQIANSIELKSK